MARSLSPQLAKTSPCDTNAATGPSNSTPITQRGDNGQWVYRDNEDFAKAIELMLRYAPRHQVAIHGYCLLHNHGHWIFEAGTSQSISNLMGRWCRPMGRGRNDHC